MDKPLNEYRDVLGVKDLAKLFDVSEQTIRKEIKGGKFGTPMRFGREYRIPKIYLITRYFQGHKECTE